MVVQDIETVGLAAYRVLFEHNPEGVLFSTPDGRISAANPAACALLDMSGEEICQLGRDGLVDQEDPRWTIAVAERDRTGSSVAVARLRRGDGRFIDIETTSRLFQDENGSVQILSILHDITGRIAIERDPQIGAAAPDGGHEVLEILEDRGIRMMIGKRPVALTKQVRRIEAEPPEQLARDERARAVPAVEDDPEPPGERPGAGDHVIDVAIDDRRRSHGPVALRKIAAVDGLPQRLDAIPMQRIGPHAQLEPVVLGRIMRPGDLDAGNDRLVIERPIEQRSRHDTHVDDVHTAAGEPLHHRLTERAPARPVVPANGHRSGDATRRQQGGKPLADRPRHALR